MSNLVLAFTQVGSAWFGTIGSIVCVFMFCVIVWIGISNYVNIRNGRKPNLLEQRANLFFLVGLILLWFYLLIEVLIILQVVPANMKDSALIIAIVIAFIGVIFELWAAIIHAKIVRQRKQ